MHPQQQHTSHCFTFSYLFSIQRGCRGRGWAFAFGLKPKVNFFVQKAEPKVNRFGAKMFLSLEETLGSRVGRAFCCCCIQDQIPLGYLGSAPSPPCVGPHHRWEGGGSWEGFLWCSEVPRAACSSTVICEMGRSESEPLWPWPAFTGSSWNSIKVIRFL